MVDVSLSYGRLPREGKKWMDSGDGDVNRAHRGRFRGHKGLGRLEAACTVDVVRSGYLQRDEHMHGMARAGGKGQHQP